MHKVRLERRRCQALKVHNLLVKKSMKKEMINALVRIYNKILCLKCGTDNLFPNGPKMEIMVPGFARTTSGIIISKSNVRNAKTLFMLIGTVIQAPSWI